MKFSIHLNDFSTTNISFLESKKNMLMEGYFTKINYLNKWFTMNGLFFYIPIKIKSIIKDKLSIKFDPYCPDNHENINKFSIIEKDLLDFYNNNKQYQHKKQLLLTKQLFNGVLKLTPENFDTIIEEKDNYVIKVSGIWETNNEIGITYKLFKAHSIIC